MDQARPVVDAPVTSGPPSIKKATGFVFIIVGSLLMETFLEQAVRILNEAAPWLTIILLLGVGVNLLRIVVDNYLYFETQDVLEVGLPLGQRLILTSLELAVLVICYDVVHKIEPAQFVTLAGLVPSVAAQQILRDFALVEFFWFAWVIVYQYALHKLRTPSTSWRPPLDTWLFLNLGCAVVLMVGANLIMPEFWLRLTAGVLPAACALTTIFLTRSRYTS